MKRVRVLLIFILGFVLISCKSKEENKTLQFESDSLLQTRYTKLLRYNIDSISFPRSYSHTNGTIKKVSSSDWTSGFFPGNLWQLYGLTGIETFKNKAKEWTVFIEKEKFNNKTHDMGFKVFNSFGQGLNYEKNLDYEKIIVKSAKTLITRFNNKVGSIRSWDHNKDKWQFPVIIDNMMNLELLFEATKITGDSIYYKIAVAHADTTLKNHFRKNHSTWHVIDYDTISGKVRARNTHQGINDNSAWARGQGWAIYGYTIVYRYTRDVKYLNQAQATAGFFLNHKNLPYDGIPYWDFDNPDIPNIPRDVSAGVIVASALIELYQYTKNKEYLSYSKKVVSNLKSKKYILSKDLDIPFILDHSFGDWSKKAEMDEPIVYGDYYFLETLVRLKALQNET